MRQIIKRPKSRKIIIADRGSRKSSLGDVLRDRSKLSNSNSKDLNKIWFEQKQIGREEHSKFENKIKKLKQIKNLKQIEQLKLKIRKTKIKKFKNKKILVIGVSCFFMIIGIFSILGNKKDQSSFKGTLGINDTVKDNELLSDRKTEEEPTFKLLYPKDKQITQSVTRKAPSGDLIHSYKDMLEGVELEVTLQELPDSFKGKELSELEKTAKAFLATEQFQVDDIMIFHGRDDKTNAQSLFFIKNGTWISILSMQPQTEDVWVGYILGLQ